MTSPKLTSRRLALLSGFALLGVVGLASVCSAESPWPRRSRRSPAPPYRLLLEDTAGRSLPTFRHGGSTFVLGETGERYSIRVENPTGERVEVVATIDGRDAVSGDVGDYVSQRGYLIEPWGTLVIEGFRRSLEEVAAFRFGEREQSYSSLRGTPENVGVIGVAFFPEKARRKAAWQPRPRRADDDYEYDQSRRGAREEAPPSSAARDGAAKSAGPQGGRASPPSNIGTQYAESRDSRVVEVAFERRSKSHPSAVLTLRYDDHAGLRARGIDLSSLGYAYWAPAEPEPFPLSPRRRFAPPP